MIFFYSDFRLEIDIVKELCHGNEKFDVAGCIL